MLDKIITLGPTGFLQWSRPRIPEVQQSESGSDAALPTLLQVGEHLARDFFQRLKNSGTLEGHGFN